jgi:hypothetical protein
MNLLHLAPHVGITCLIINSAIAVTYFFKWRSQRKRANAYRTRVDVLLVDNAGLRAQNARLIQTVAKLRGSMRTLGVMCENFDIRKEAQ